MQMRQTILISAIVSFTLALTALLLMGEERDSYVGAQYPPYPPECVVVEGGLLLVPGTNALSDLAFKRAICGGRHFLWLQKQIGQPDDKVLRWEVVESVGFPRLSSDQKILFSDCGYQENYELMTFVVATTQPGTDGDEVLSISFALRINPSTRKIERVDEQYVSCN